MIAPIAIAESILYPGARTSLIILLEKPPWGEFGFFFFFCAFACGEDSQVDGHESCLDHVRTFDTNLTELDE